MNKFRLGGAMVALVVLLIPSRVDAQTPPVVSIAASTPASVFYGCGGELTGTDAGSVTIQRTTADTSLAVTFVVTGSVTPSSGTATFETGAATVTVVLTPSGASQPSFDFALSAGSGYSLGDPATLHVNGVVAQPSCVVPTTATSTTVEVSPDTIVRTGAKATRAESLAGLALILGGLGLVGLAVRVRRRFN